MVIKGLVTDWDGTVVNSEVFGQFAWFVAMRVLRATNAELVEGEVSVEDLLQLRSRTPQDCERLMKAKWGSRFPYQFLKQLRDETFAEFFAVHTLPFCDGSEKLLRYCKSEGLKIALVTSSRRNVLQQMVRRLNIGDLFDVVCASDDLPEGAHGKPEPDPYDFACRELGLSPHQCVAVEDTVVGAVSAHRAGIRRVYVIPNLDTASLVRDCLSKYDRVAVVSDAHENRTDLSDSLIGSATSNLNPGSTEDVS